MIPITQPSINFTPDQQVKIKAAVKQMTQLIAQVDQWVKYRLLSSIDRDQLIEKGYARDLVDNLVYVTQRFSNKDTDHLTLGFTNEAFDPSLYASKVSLDTLCRNNKGCCSWCESYIEHNQAHISHYRPVAGYTEDGIMHRKSYFELAYEQSNLLYTCWSCSELYKSDQFPVADNKRMPSVALKDEKPTLINPYLENPRNHIRFNPLNAQAYDYGIVSLFYKHHGKSEPDIEELLWCDPANIPLQKSVTGESLSLPDIDSAYSQWFSQQVDSAKNSRGQSNIDILGLNRAALIRSRADHLRYLRAQYLNGVMPARQTATVPDKHNDNVSTASIDNLQYASLTIDALNTWKKIDSTTAVDDKASQK